MSRRLLVVVVGCFDLGVNLLNLLEALTRRIPFQSSQEKVTTKSISRPLGALVAPGGSGVCTGAEVGRKVGPHLGTGDVAMPFVTIVAICY